jgi:diaminopimelate decarboxylase
MQYVQAKVTQGTEFYGKQNPVELIGKYGSPLYVYSERILRERCQDIRRLVTIPNFIVNYSAKANSNLTLLKINNDEGCCMDAMSPGEIHVRCRRDSSLSKFSTLVTTSQQKKCYSPLTVASM